jgi:hypothetical protein
VKGSRGVHLEQAIETLQPRTTTAPEAH